MSHHLLRLLLSAVFLTGLAACKAKQTNAEAQALKVQNFQKRQKIEAIKTYTALVTKYPESEFAPKAQERLTVLGPMPAATPAPKK